MNNTRSSAAAEGLRDALCWSKYCRSSSEVGEKVQRKLRLFLEIFGFRICLINILQLQTALSPKPEALDSAGGTTPDPLHGSKSRARNDSIDLVPEVNKQVSKYLFIYLHTLNVHVAIEINREMKAQVPTYCT